MALNNSTTSFKELIDQQNDIATPSNHIFSISEPKGSMTNIAHPFFYIIFGGVLFIVFSTIITIFTIKYVKRKYRKFKHSRLMNSNGNNKNGSKKHKNIKKHFQKSSIKIDNDRVALDMDEVEHDQDFSQDNITFSVDGNKYKNTIIT